VLLVCMLATTLIDMVAGVTLGVIIASILFMKKISESSAVQVESSKTLGRKKLAKIPEDTMLLRIQGAFFFGTAEKAFDRTAMINKKIKRLIIDLSNVSLLDITGVLAMSSMIERSTAAGIKVYVCGPERFIEKISRNIDAKQLQAIEFQPSLDSVITSLSA
jgi:SulP family sulfate permease